MITVPLEGSSLPNDVVDRRPRLILFARPRLKIRARPASLRMKEHDETEGGYRGDNARSCADQRYRSHLDC
jgi:hypothetical protein